MLLALPARACLVHWPDSPCATSPMALHVVTECEEHYHHLVLCFGHHSCHGQVLGQSHSSYSSCGSCGSYASHHTLCMPALPTWSSSSVGIFVPASSQHDLTREYGTDVAPP